MHKKQINEIFIWMMKWMMSSHYSNLLPFTESYAVSIVIITSFSTNSKAIDYANNNQVYYCDCNEQFIANYHFR